MAAVMLLQVVVVEDSEPHGIANLAMPKAVVAWVATNRAARHPGWFVVSGDHANIRYTTVMYSLIGQ